MHPAWVQREWHRSYPMWVFDSETLRFLAVDDAAIQHDGHSRDEFLAMTILAIRSLEGVPAARALEGAVGTGLARRGRMAASQEGRHDHRRGDRPEPARVVDSV